MTMNLDTLTSSSITSGDVEEGTIIVVMYELNQKIWYAYIMGHLYVCDDTFIQEQLELDPEDTNLQNKLEEIETEVDNGALYYQVVNGGITTPTGINPQNTPVSGSISHYGVKPGN